MTTLIRVRNLTKIFALAEHGGKAVSLLGALRAGRREIVHRHVAALKDLSFEAREGERIGIIGRNGAGKTTLLSILAGVAEPTSGEVAIKGDVHAMLTIGAVLRDDATGRENLYLDGAVHGRSREEMDARAEAVIAFSELGEFIDRPVRTYSSGMKARLAFSMGAFIDPDILIIDETLSVGDAFFAEKAIRRMKEITAQGRVVIMVSHDLASIEDMCERCLWLDEGRLVMDGPAKAVTAAYQTAVQQADEEELARKFGAPSTVPMRPEAGLLISLTVGQSGRELSATARAFQPLSVTVQGKLSGTHSTTDLELAIVRVDGRKIYRRRLTAEGGGTCRTLAPSRSPSSSIP